MEKNKRWKSIKILFTMLAVIMLVSNLKTVVYATDTNTTAEGYEYAVQDDGTVEITYYTGSAAELIIPETIDGKSVTSIGSWAFYECSSLRSIEIPESVTSIGNWAFYECSSLRSIEIPENVTSIGTYAFLGCASLTSIKIPESVTSIGDAVFDGCSSLEAITVDENNAVYDSRGNCNAIIRTKDNSLIAGCKNTKIPESVTSIGSWAFYGCSSLIRIEIPESVTRRGGRL